MRLLTVAKVTIALIGGKSVTEVSIDTDMQSSEFVWILKAIVQNVLPYFHSNIQLKRLRHTVKFSSCAPGCMNLVIL